MSAEAMGWVWKNSPYTGTNLVLHLAVADIANDTHDYRVWLSTATLAEKAHTPKETASRWLWKAVEDGLLDVVDDRRDRRDGQGRRVSSEFRLVIPSGGQPLTTDQWSIDDRSMEPLTTDQPSIDHRSQVTQEEITQEKTPAATAARQPFADEFAAWYSSYPRCRERGNALKAYQARRRQGASSSDLLAAAEEYARFCRKKGTPDDKIKYPASFLNNGWEDWLPGGAALAELQSKSSGSVLVAMGNGSTIRMLR